MKSKKKIIIVSAVGVAVLTVVMVLTLVCFHSWTDATCDTPMTCKKCGKTKGEALSHEWIAATCKEAKHCSRCGITDGEPLAHSFNEATCELPKTCSVCGATEGEPIGHKWNEANCVSPKTCMVCGLTEGDLGEHKWKSATYNSPKTCSVCGKTNGVPLTRPSQSYTQDLPQTSAQIPAQARKNCLICGSSVTRSDTQYCGSHDCGKSGCPYPAKRTSLSWGSFCEFHSCSDPKCTTERYSGSYFCSAHKDR